MSSNGDALIPFDSSLSPFQPTKILRFEQGGKFVVILGRIARPISTEPLDSGPEANLAAATKSNIGTSEEEEWPAILQLEQKGACSDPSAFLDGLSSFNVSLTNHSGAEYSFYEARGFNATFDAEVIWPASERQIIRKTPSLTCICEESADVYQQVVAEHAHEQAQNVAWLDAVVNLDKERERNLFSNERFIINVDTKWKTHGEFSEHPNVRATWNGAQWTEDLYILAISSDPKLKSLRDLHGEAGANLCDQMVEKLRSCALGIYGVEANQLRIFFHYHPQFYRLHAHCTRLAVNPGCETERAHLLTTVAQNLRLDPDYYAKITLTYRLRIGESLHKKLIEAQTGIL